MRALVILLLLTGVARAEPSDRTLVYIGLGLAPVDYLLGVGLHEGSHALGAKLVGATVDSVHLFPPGVDPRVKRFRFGWTYVHGIPNDRARAFFYLAPKITDTILLGGIGALALANAYPDNRYGALALTVFATGLWIDFAKDTILFHDGDDVVRAFNLWCMRGYKQIPARIVYIAADVGLGYLLYRAYKRTFDQPTSSASSALVVPMLTSTF